MGWLASTPEKDKDTRSRGERYLDAGLPPPLVEIEAGDYLIEAMRELGPVRSNGMSLTIPHWQELEAFARSNGLDLRPWEFRAIRKLCAAYLSGFNSGKEALSIPPIERDQP